MNKELTESIAYHILSGFGALPSSFINQEKVQPLNDKRFLLPEKLPFIDNEGRTNSKNIYGCQIKTPDGKSFRVLLGDCTTDKSLPEYCLVVHLDDSPAYGVYLVFNRLVKDPPDSEALITVSTDKKSWIVCTTYLQATFLAGMEHLKELGSNWSKCTDYQDQYQMLLSLIKFHAAYFDEESNEGQES